MRIISQDGRVDLPYEQVAVAIDYDDEMAILAYAVSSGTIWELAEYSTEEKAEKAMERLRAEYEKFQETKSINGSYFALDYPKVFRFPWDSEV